MCHTIPNLSFKDLIFESWVDDLHLFNKIELYSLEQSEVIASQTREQVFKGQVNLCNLISYSGFRLVVLDLMIFFIFTGYQIVNVQRKHKR